MVKIRVPERQMKEEMEGRMTVISERAMRPSLYSELPRAKEKEASGRWKHFVNILK